MDGILKIAILGWGSLIWDRRFLAIDSAWRLGPRLPVEFARKSQGGRVTLVLMQGYQASPVFWALSSHSDVRDACSNLQSRERGASRNIHFTRGTAFVPATVTTQVLRATTFPAESRSG